MAEPASSKTPSVRDVDPVTDLLSRLRLDVSARREAVFIVEGRDDRVTLPRVTGRDGRRFFAVAGRTNVLRCARLMRHYPLAGVVCVADRDFDESEYNWPGVVHLVFSDGADLESMMIDSPALDRFLEEWAVAGKLAAFGGVRAVRPAVVDELAPLSALRSANACGRVSVSFDAIPLQALFDKGGQLNVTSLVNRLADASSCSRPEVQNALSTVVPVSPQTRRPLVRGKDSIELLSVLLRKAIASLSAQQVASKFVERPLRLAASPGDFDGTPFLARLDTATLEVAAA